MGAGLQVVLAQEHGERLALDVGEFQGLRRERHDILYADAPHLGLRERFLLLPGRVRDQTVIGAGGDRERRQEQGECRASLAESPIVVSHGCIPHSMTKPAWPAVAAALDEPAIRCVPSAFMVGSVGSAGAAGLEIGWTM